MKFGRRNFLKGLSSLAAAWMVKPALPKRELPKLEDPPEVDNAEQYIEGTQEGDTVELRVGDKICGGEVRVNTWPEDCCHCKQYCDVKCPNYSWPVSCGACDRYACHKDCPRHATNPYFHCRSYGDTFRSLEEQQARRAHLKESRRILAEKNA